MRINSSENLELLKQSYIWNISSRFLFFLFRVFWWWKKKKTNYSDPYSTSKCLFLYPAEHGRSSCQAKPRRELDTGPILWARPAGLGPSRTGTQPTRARGALWNTLQVSRTYKWFPTTHLQILLYNSGHVAAWKQTFSLWTTLLWGKGDCKKLGKGVIAINTGGRRGKLLMVLKVYYSLFT